MTNQKMPRYSDYLFNYLTLCSEDLTRMLSFMMDVSHELVGFGPGLVVVLT